MAPRPRWNAVAPAWEAAIMCERASMLPGSRTAVGSQSFTSRAPSTAMPRAKGW